MRRAFVAARFSSRERGTRRAKARAARARSEEEEKKREREAAEHDLRETKERTKGGGRHASASECMRAVRRGVIYATINEHSETRRKLWTSRTAGTGWLVHGSGERKRRGARASRCQTGAERR